LYSENELIFISLAAYRDPQLAPTVEDCLRKASAPERLRFGICRQGEAQDAALPFADDARFRVLEVNWRDSKGACWARAEIMKLWHGEEWFLQVDSHSRFGEGWDAKLIRSAKETGSGKPIVSTYPCAFTPGEREILQGSPLQMVFQEFTPEGIPQLRPGPMPPGIALEKPLRARFLAAGFLFAPGRFVEEVPYDPELYFMGEESAMTVRAFTHGYDLFHPAEAIVWHDYIRADARKHWGDHADAEQVSTPWNKLDEASKQKVQRVLLGEDVGAFGLGRARTLSEYEAYAGISFRYRKAQGYTLRGSEPPNPSAPEDWPNRIYPWIAKIRFTREQMPEGSLVNPMLWSLSILDDQGNEVCHRDLRGEDLQPFTNNDGELSIVCEFASDTIPANWTLWPLTRSGQWLPRFGGNLREEDFAIVGEQE
jgi:hypothetical protein